MKTAVVRLPFYLSYYSVVICFLSTVTSTVTSFSLIVKKKSSPTRIKMTAQERVDSNTQEAIWCPERQIYMNGQVPTAGKDTDILLQQLLDMNQGNLFLFGYGSLCWNPGQPDQDTLAMTHLGVTSKVASAIGYKRCWAQKSADHRGTPSFPGIVCTLLNEDELALLQKQQQQEGEEYSPSTYITTGILFSVPSTLVNQVLTELDFREKGGYARDIINVLDHETGQKVKALLYRGTPDNPAFWYRAFADLSFAAAVISQAIGPSGPNDFYLNSLNQFLCKQPRMIGNHVHSTNTTANQHDSDTQTLARLTHTIQKYANVYFIVASGSNQYNQLSIPQEEGRDLKQLTEAVLFVPRDTGDERMSETQSLSTRKRPKHLYAGGGHSALLTMDGFLYLWGWNQYGQLGRKDSYQKYTTESSEDTTNSLSMIPPLYLDQAVLKVEKAALGHFHTLIIEHETKMLYGFGEDSRGQVSAQRTSIHPSICETLLTIPLGVRRTDRFVDIAAGLYHSAAVAVNGYLVTFGDPRYGVTATSTDSSECIRWRPEDGSHIVQVACGHRHTVALDEHGRVWAMGENNFSQLGRSPNDEASRWHTPHLVQGPLGEKGSGCIRIVCGWSHTLAVVSDSSSSKKVLGWGRNDRGQLGLGENSESVIHFPQYLFSTMQQGQKSGHVICGSESTHFVDEEGKLLLGCGWNEHGNLGMSSCDENAYQLTAATGARLVKPPYSEQDESDGTFLIAAGGGAHFLAMLK